MFNKSKSPETFISSTPNLTVLNQNILYLTREVDKIVRMVKLLSIDDKLQTQVDKYFEDDETSPQTDTESRRL